MEKRFKNKNVQPDFGLKGKEHGREEWTYNTGMRSIASTWNQMKRREGRGKFKPKRRKRGNGSTIFRFHNGLESEYFFFIITTTTKTTKALSH